MTPEEYKRLAREAISIWPTGDLDAADEVYAPNYVNHQHHDPDDPPDLHGAEASQAAEPAWSRPMSFAAPGGTIRWKS